MGAIRLPNILVLAIDDVVSAQVWEVLASLWGVAH